MRSGLSGCGRWGTASPRQYRGRRDIALYTKNGYDYAAQFRGLSQMFKSIAARGVVIDGELVACDEQGAPDFRALHTRATVSAELCIWAFDLLHLDGCDLCDLALIDRKRLLEKLVHRTNEHWLRYSETFDDGVKLLAAAERMGLEGVVSKLALSRYRSGRSAAWSKVKCPSWRAANKDRWRLFEKRR